MNDTLTGGAVTTAALLILRYVGRAFLVWLSKRSGERPKLVGASRAGRLDAVERIDKREDAIITRLESELERYIGLNGALEAANARLRKERDECFDSRAKISQEATTAIFDADLATKRARTEMDDLRLRKDARIEIQDREIIRLVDEIAEQRNELMERGPKRLSKAMRDSAPLIGRKILIIEDDVKVLGLVAQIFLEAGGDVRTAPGAASAYRVFTAWRPEVCFVDVKLSGESGKSLLRRIRALPPEEGGNVIAIATSGYSSEQERRECAEAGFDEFVEKPYAPDEIIALVVQLIADRRER